MAIQFGSFGLGVFASSDIVASAHVDQTCDQLIFQNNGYYFQVNNDGTVTDSNQTAYNTTSMDAALSNNSTYVQAKGIILGEVPLGYGHKFELSGGDIMVGGALKYMSATTYTENMKIDNSDSQAGSTKNDKTESGFGVDLGLAYQPYFSKDLTLGLVAKNLNSPEFSFQDGTKTKNRTYGKSRCCI